MARSMKMCSSQVMDVLRSVTALIVVAGALGLGGCVTYTPPRPFTTQAEVLAAKGEPSRRWSNDDGTTTLEYATQPNGRSCLMVQIDQGGIVLRQWDALSEENLARVQRGMTRDEVDRLLGQHRSEQVFKMSGEEVWDWNVRHFGPGVATLFNVHFIDGKVVRTSQTHIYPREGPSYGPWGYPPPFYRHPFFPPHPFFPYW